MAEKTAALEAHRAGKLLLPPATGWSTARMCCSYAEATARWRPPSAPVARTGEEGTTSIAPGAPPNHGAFIAEYERRRGEQDMEIEQALTFVGHHFRMEHLLFQPVE